MDAKTIVNIASGIAVAGAALVSAASVVINSRNNFTAMNNNGCMYVPSQPPYNPYANPYRNPYENPYRNPYMNPYMLTNVPQPVIQQPIQPVYTAPSPIVVPVQPQQVNPVMPVYDNNELMWYNDPTSRRWMDSNIMQNNNSFVQCRNNENNYNSQNYSTVNPFSYNYGWNNTPNNFNTNTNMFNGNMNMNMSYQNQQQQSMPASYNCMNPQCQYMNTNPTMYNYNTPQPQWNIGQYYGYLNCNQPYPQNNYNYNYNSNNCGYGYNNYNYQQPYPQQQYDRYDLRWKMDYDQYSQPSYYPYGYGYGYGYNGCPNTFGTNQQYSSWGMTNNSPSPSPNFNYNSNNDSNWYNDDVWKAKSPQSCQSNNETLTHVTGVPPAARPITSPVYDKPHTDNNNNTKQTTPTTPQKPVPDANGVVPLFGPPDWFIQDNTKSI